MIKLLLSLLILVPFGQDYLGGAKFQSAIIQNHDYSQGAGMFATTFGDSLPLAQQLASRRIPFLRIQLAWSDTHDYKESQFPEIVKQAKRFCPLATKTKLYLSGACEHNLDANKANKLASQILATCPQATYVNVPWRGAVLPQYINETHGNGNPKSARSSFSSDGTASEDSDIQSLKNKPYSEFFMFWSPEYNLRIESNDSTPRPQRTHKPSADLIKSLIYLAKDKGPTSFPKNWLMKSHAETKPKPDPRANKPVFIVPIKTSKVELSKNGKVIESCDYYGPFEDKSRYYCKNYGYNIGAVDVIVNKKKQGFLNMGFRTGGFR